MFTSHHKACDFRRGLFTLKGYSTVTAGAIATMSPRCSTKAIEDRAHTPAGSELPGNGIVGR
ncbi:MAG: hypothetical protein JWO52_1481 [Gammaproteobacteria bacterium]|jgi:hypothetical protein|nr:hypothetical protein [Gammaproteobacteria bacterium]